MILDRCRYYYDWLSDNSIRLPCGNVHVKIEVGHLLSWILSVIRQERANLKTEVTRRQSTPSFPKNDISYPLICTCTCAYQWVRNVRFSENWACFVFLKHLGFTFALLPSYRRFLFLSCCNRLLKRAEVSVYKCFEKSYRQRLNQGPKKHLRWIALQILHLRSLQGL